MFGKLARVPDELVPEYRRLTLDFFRDPAEADRVASALADGSADPWAEKRRLAREIVDLYHGSGEGERAEARFDQVHREHEVPRDVIEVGIPEDAVVDGSVWLPRLLKVLGLVASVSEARRLMSSRAVKLDGIPVDETDCDFSPEALDGQVIQIGRRRLARGVRLRR
jgi:tyrosyl-tRNA synthetase